MQRVVIDRHQHEVGILYLDATSEEGYDVVPDDKMQPQTPLGRPMKLSQLSVPCLAMALYVRGRRSSHLCSLWFH